HTGAGDAERLLHDPRAARLVPDRHADAFGTHPAGEMPGRVLQLLERGKDLEEAGLVGGTMPEVGADRRGEIGGAGDEQTAQRREVGAALGRWRKGTRAEGRPLP